MALVNLFEAQWAARVIGSFAFFFDPGGLPGFRGLGPGTGFGAAGTGC